jgi:L-threonylcarbamoyladenylate synthase
MHEEVREAAGVIRSGGIILYPTDTIWGIGCDATSPPAVQRVYEIKQRSDRRSMLVLVSGPEMLEKYLVKVPAVASEIIRSALKPTTIIYPGAVNLAANLVAEDGSVGIRITSDPFCLELIRMTGLPIVSTSANTSGNPSPDIFQEIEQAIIDRVDHVVRWRQDETTPANPSAIIKVDERGATTLLRP